MAGSNVQGRRPETAADEGEGAPGEYEDRRDTAMR